MFNINNEYQQLDHYGSDQLWFSQCIISHLKVSVVSCILHKLCRMVCSCTHSNTLRIRTCDYHHSF